MQTKKIFLSIIFIAANILAQGQCSTCADNSNYITNNGNETFTASIAQGYYWEICEGNASISGSNTNRTITVSNNGGDTYKLKVSRFNNGECFDACEIVSCSSCSDLGNIITNNQDGTFTASSAQGLYWEICEGNASIVGSNTTQTVEVAISGTIGNFKIIVSRFSNGECSDACETLTNFVISTCIDDLIIDASTPFQNLYQSNSTIATQGNVTIQSNQQSEYRSNRVTLNQGFSVLSGSDFKVRIGGCD